MTDDIVVRLDKLLDDINMYDHYRPVIRKAAREIKCLRRLCRDLARVQHDNEEMYGKAADEIERLRRAPRRKDNVTILSGG